MFDMNIFLDLIAAYEEENKLNALLYNEDVKFLVSKNLKEKLYADFCEKYFLKGIAGIRDYYCVLKDENKILEKEILWTDDDDIIAIIEIKMYIKLEKGDHSNEQISKEKSKTEEI